MENSNETLKELTLILIYLCSWQERGSEGRRSWKGYDFDILNELSDENLIEDSRRSKSVWFTEEGEKAAQELLKKYHVDI
jgi:hypothetical protein